MEWFDGLTVPKDPDAVLDFAWEFGPTVNPWIEDGDSLASHAVSSDSGITVDSSAIDGTQVVVWLSGGTAGESYDVTVRVTSADGRTDDKTITFEVSER